MYKFNIGDVLYCPEFLDYQLIIGINLTTYSVMSLRDWHVGHHGFVFIENTYKKAV